MAAFDLNCPKSELRYQRIDDDTWGVVGCEQRAKYVRICHSAGFGIGTHQECRWVKN